MKVERPGRPNVSQVQEKGPAKGADEARGANKPPSERVDVSNLSKLLSSVRASEQIDVPKVERLRESISAGTYKVDQEKVAEAMLREEV
jgi:flagellar biosynthesis anti-sigma factor FlgM